MSTHPVRETLRRQLNWLTGLPSAPTVPAHRAGAHLLLGIALLLLVGNARVGLAFATLVDDALTQYDTLVGAVVFSFTVLSYLPHFALLVAPLLATLHVHRKWVLRDPEAPTFTRGLAATLALVGLTALLILPRDDLSPIANAAWIADALPWLLTTQALVLVLALSTFALTFRNDLTDLFTDEPPRPHDAERWRVADWANDTWPPKTGLRRHIRRALTFARDPVPDGPRAYRTTGHLLRAVCWASIGTLLGGLLFFAFVLFLFLFATAGGPEAFHVDSPHHALLGVVVLFQFLTLGGLLAALGLVLAANAAYRTWVRRGPFALRAALLLAATLAGAGATLLALAAYLPLTITLDLGASPAAAGAPILLLGLLLGGLALRRDVRGHLRRT